MNAIFKQFRRISLSFAVLGAAACAGSTVDTQEAEVRDSFVRPTPHGELVFGVENKGSFTGDDRFHAWTFTLTDQAKVELTTKLFAQNLDSVVYLYRESQANYVAKNDDHQDQPESRIIKTLPAGNYTVKVKASKVFQTGDFALLGACTGAGCPEVSDHLCSGNEAAPMPTPTGYDPSCDASLHALLTTPKSATPPACGPTLEKRASAYYKQYWDGVIGYDELTGGENIEPSVEVSYHQGAGAVVKVDVPGDETAMKFAFDAEGKLIAYFQHNQSPDWAWFCEPGSEQVEEPDEDCLREILSHQNYDAANVSEGTGATRAGDDLSMLDPIVAAAVREYTAGMREGAGVSFTFTRWTERYYGGASVAFSSDDKQHMTYVVSGNPDYGLRVTFVTDEDGRKLVCKEL